MSRWPRWMFGAGMVLAALLFVPDAGARLGGGQSYSSGGSSSYGGGGSSSYGGSGSHGGSSSSSYDYGDSNSYSGGGSGGSGSVPTPVIFVIVGILFVGIVRFGTRGSSSSGPNKLYGSPPRIDPLDLLAESSTGFSRFRFRDSLAWLFTRYHEGHAVEGNFAPGLIERMPRPDDDVAVIIGSITVVETGFTSPGLPSAEVEFEANIMTDKGRDYVKERWLRLAQGLA